MQFWERVKTEIKTQNTTQDWTSKQAGVSINTFKGWIAKGIMPNADQAYAIAKALGVTVEYLVTGDMTGMKSLAYRNLERRLSRYTDEQLEQADRILEVAIAHDHPLSNQHLA